MIYCVEDDSGIRNMMVYTLAASGFEAEGLPDGKALFEALARTPCDLILLDIMLPGEDGIRILEKLRADASTENIPVIMASAKGTEYDKVVGLDLGADDYLTKPFALEELAARVQAHLRRQERSAPGRPAGGPIQIGAIRLDPEKLTVTKAGAPVALSTRELELLTYLMRHAGETLSRDRIFHDVWRTDYGDVGTVAINIKNLRSKLDPEWRYIKTVWGSGYRFVTQSGFAEEEAEKG